MMKLNWHLIKTEFLKKEFIWVIFSAGVLALPSFFLVGSRFYHLLGFINFVFSFFIFLLPLLLIVRSPRIYFAVLSPLFLFNIVEIGHFFLFGVPSTPVTYHLLLETTLGEIWQFIKTYPLPVIQAFIFLCIPLFFIFYKLPIRLKLKKRFRYGIISFILILAIPFIFISKFSTYGMQNIHPLSLGKKLYDLFEKNLQIQEMLLLRNKHQFHAQVSDSKNPHTIVLVIGESVRRDHLALYGYPRPTTPHLSRIADKLIYFTDISSPATRTVPSIQISFSLATPDDLEKFYKTSSLLGLAKESGYFVTWISNQGIMSPIDTGPTIISKEADHVEYLNPLNLNSKFDMIMIPALEKALSEKHPKKLIILHMLGSHFNYQDRYPSEFNLFKDSPPNLIFQQKDPSTWPIINAYDNSILYLDYFLNEVIARLENKNAVLVYMSDHGETLYDDLNQTVGHSLPLVTKQQYEVPLIFWTSESYLQSKYQQVQYLKKNRHKKLSMSAFIHTMGNLMETEFPDLNLQESFFSPQLKNNKNRKVINIQMNVEKIP